MIVACPYSNKASWKRRQESFQSLTKCGYPYTYENVDGTTYDAWFLNKWHTATDDLLIVEHDNVITKSMAQTLEACKEPICVQNYKYSDGISVHRNVTEGRVVERIVDEEWADLWGFGTVRFKLSFIKSHPWTLEDIGYQRKGEGLSLDSRFSAWCLKQGYRGHVHYPTAKHHHNTEVFWTGGMQVLINQAGVQKALKDLQKRLLSYSIARYGEDRSGPS
jgi:hypothetical protein